MAVYTTINDPSAYFQVLTYTGDDNNNRALVNTGNSNLQPDWVWIKNRTGGTKSHQLVDSSRGVTKYIFTDGTDAESTLTNRLDSFDTDGFTTDNHSSVNASDRTYVAWQWKANGGTTSNFSESGANPGGTIQTNTTAGFSIIDYTGTGSAGTISHGLGKVPEWIVFKDRSGDGDDWFVYHVSTGNDGGVRLNTNATDGNDSNRFNNTSPTTSVFTVGASGGTNDDGNPTIAYCFAPIQGFSKFGKYKGNGNANGPFIYLGFKPKYFLLKNISATQNWYVFDTARDIHNPSNSAMQVSSNAIQETGYAMDFVSNGFKIRHTDGAWNGNGNTYIYMAFAEHPLVTSDKVPTTAR